VAKLPYQSPEIERLGSVTEITAAGGGSINPQDNATGYGASGGYGS
jgi:hypothetical protein